MSRWNPLNWWREEEPLTIEDRIAELKVVKSKLEREVELLGKQAGEAKRNGNVQKARTLITQRAAKQKRIGELDGLCANLEAQHDATQSAETSLAVVGGMRDGNLRMKDAMNELDVEDIRQVTVETHELMHTVDEVGAMLSDPHLLSNPRRELEIDMDAELDALDTQILPDAPLHPITRDPPYGNGGVRERINGV